MKLIISLFNISCMSLTLSATAMAVTKGNFPNKPWLRLPTPIEHMKINRQGTRVAFTTKDGKYLHYLDLKTLKVKEITMHQVGPSWFWSPDGIRILYREHLRVPKNLILSRLQAYDLILDKTVHISEFNEPTGILTLDPRDLRFTMLTSKGVHTNRLKFPDKREARWQMATRDVDGKFLVTQNAVLWLTEGGLSMQRLESDDSQIQSFDISPDGLAIVWATEADRIYYSEAGASSTHFDYGRDPKWHPVRRQIIYAGARRIGSVTHNYDLKIGDTKGKRKFISRTQFHNERWPVWAGDANRILFTRDNTTDLYEMDL